MVFKLSDHPSIGNVYINELRDHEIQQDPLRFRHNLERIGEVLGYEISKQLAYEDCQVETVLGEAEGKKLVQQPVLGAILRAGLPLHQGLLRIFDRAENLFVSAYRQHHKDGTFEINLQYISCPRLDGRTLILADPMLATGASMVLTIQELMRYGNPESIHVVVAIAAVDGLGYLQRKCPGVNVWLGALDEELTAKSYIVPGLGDAGDLAYGVKLQE